MALTAMDLVAQAKKHIVEIEVTAAKNALEASLILDVREPAEYATGHLPGAFNIPRGVLEFKIGSHPDFQDKHPSPQVTPVEHRSTKCEQFCHLTASGPGETPGHVDYNLLFI